MVQPPTKDALHARGSMSFYDSLGASEGVGFGLSLTTARGESASGRFQLGTNARVLDGDGNDVVPGVRRTGRARGGRVDRGGLLQRPGAVRSDVPHDRRHPLRRTR